MLEAPCALADIQRNRVAAEFIHRNLHRSASAKRRVKEDKRDALSVKRALAIVAAFDLLGEIDQRNQLIGREVGCAEKVSSFQIHKFRVWLIEDRLRVLARLSWERRHPCLPLSRETPCRQGCLRSQERPAKTQNPSLSQGYFAQLIQEQINLRLPQRDRRKQPQYARIIRQPGDYLFLQERLLNGLGDSSGELDPN